MRGEVYRNESLFSYINPERRVPDHHPLRAVRLLVDEVLERLDDRFTRIYAIHGRPSIPPEYLLRALLLQVLYGIRSERQLMEQLDYNLLFRWFAGLSMDDPVWDATVFTKNRDRLAAGDIAALFLRELLALPEVGALLSDEHFSVDGTLIEAWASHKSFRLKEEDGDGEGGGGDFHGRKRMNETHASKTDKQARLYRKGSGKEAKLCYMGHVQMENRNGLAVDGLVTKATGTAEREAALKMAQRRLRDGLKITQGADKGYDTKDHTAGLAAIGVISHAARHDRGRSSSIGEDVAATPGYGMSQTRRKMVECIFGFGKQAGTMRKTKHRGVTNVAFDFMLNLIGYNLVRLPKLLSG